MDGWMGSWNLNVDVRPVEVEDSRDGGRGLASSGGEVARRSILISHRRLVIRRRCCCCGLSFVCIFQS